MVDFALSDVNTYVIIGYISDVQSIVEAMKDTCTNTTAKARIQLKQI